MFACKSANKQSNDSSIAVSDDEEVVVPMGQWEIGYYKDDFGEFTDEKYVYQVVDGFYKYQDTDEMNMVAYIVVDDTDVLFRLKTLSTYESDREDVTFAFKYDSGAICEFKMIADKDGYITASTQQEKINLRQLLCNGGEIRVSAVVRWLGEEKKFNFSFDADDLENALAF